MNIMLKLGDAIGSTNSTEREATAALDFFARGTGLSDPRNGPAYSSLCRRRARMLRHFS